MVQRWYRATVTSSRWILKNRSIQVDPTAESNGGTVSPLHRSRIQLLLINWFDMTTLTWQVHVWRYRTRSNKERAHAWSTEWMKPCQQQGWSTQFDLFCKFALVIKISLLDHSLSIVIDILTSLPSVFSLLSLSSLSLSLSLSLSSNRWNSSQSRSLGTRRFCLPSVCYASILVRLVAILSCFILVSVFFNCLFLKCRLCLDCLEILQTF